MSDPWRRPYYKAGGADAYVHYVVFGAAPQSLRVSGSRHRYSGHEAIAVSAVARDSPSFFVPEEPAWQRILAGSGVAPALVTGPEQQVVVSGTVADPDSLLYLRDTVALVTA